jgi:hypothetical protein
MDGAGWEPNDSKRAAKAHAEAVAKAQANPKAPPWGKVWGRVDIDRGRALYRIGPGDIQGVPGFSREGDANKVIAPLSTVADTDQAASLH